MKLTKYGHACFTVQKDASSLIVDPGSWSTDLVVPDNVTAVVVTHEHPDHFDITQLRVIAAQNPDVVVYAPASVTSQIGEISTQTVTPSETIEVGSFTLHFIGGTHATIHQDYHPPFENVGVIINSTLYHPGDSLVVPTQPIDVLSLPITAPWEKVSESIDFLTAVKPRLAFPCHDAILSVEGISLYDNWHTRAAERCGTTYQRLHETIEIDG
jgi:L-ascorbate metabolism protein UlaG (beta-lactamase superfamily)